MMSWLLTYFIHSTILLGCAAIVAWRFNDQHAWLDRIWKMALTAPLVTATVSLDVAMTPVGSRWAMPPVTTLTSTSNETASSTSNDTVSLSTSDTPTSPAAADREAPTRSVDRVTTTRSTVAVPEKQSTQWSPVLSSVPIVIVAAWLALASLLIARYLVRLRYAYRALRSGSPVTSPDVLDTIARLRTEGVAQCPVRVSINDLCRVPLVLGGGHIVLPQQFFDELDPEQQRAALAHELAHIVRRDPQWRIVADLIERAFFFQPLNYVARARLCDSAEFLCDEWAVRRTASAVAMARCLSIVASWWTSADALPAGVSPMARSDSAMIRRVTRILDTPAVASKPRWFWLAIPVALVAVAAPRVTASQLPTAATTTQTAFTTVLAATSAEKAPEQGELHRQLTADELAAARRQLRVYRIDRPGASLDDRWREALADAARERFGDFWIAYSLTVRAHADELMISDSRDGSVWFSDGRPFTQGPPLSELINPSAVALEGGNVVALFHYRDPRADAIDRAGYRSAQLGFDFGRRPVFWLGDGAEAQSFARVQTLFGAARDRKIQRLLIDLASLHPNSDVVIPFLASLLDQKWPAEIRAEAAEGFDHHHDPRSVEILLRVARTDPDGGVRSEAAETIGEVQTPQSIPALTDLVNESPDPEVRREAAEAFSEQPADRALPAIEKIVATIQEIDVVNEAIEAIGELHDPRALPLLVQIANTHPQQEAQKEAVETIGEIDDVASVVDALTRIAWEHADVDVQREAVETLGDCHEDASAMAAVEKIAREHAREDVQAEAIETLEEANDHTIHPLLLELALSGRSPRIRRQAIESLAESVSKISDQQLLDQAQTVIERAVFDDADASVQAEAIDALDEFPSDRALRIWRDVVARHPSARIRREAGEHLRQ